MDLVTQGLLGSALAQSVSRGGSIRCAAIIGLLSGVLADADVLIHSSTDPLLTLEYHRHFTHSVFFIPIGALIAALLAWPFFRRKLSFSHVYLYAFAGYSLSGFIDACTSYGTYWLWPLLNERYAFAIISIVDPVFTLVLLVAVIIGVVKQRPGVVFVGLLLCSLYLLLGFAQSLRVEKVGRDLASQRGHEVEQVFVKPTLGNLLLWRSIYISREHIYIDAIRAGFGQLNLYEGGHVPLLDVGRDLPGLDQNSVQMRDVERFSEWSDGYVSFNEATGQLGDMRYSVLPNSTVPLWGLEIDTAEPNRHAVYAIERSLTEVQKHRFKMMLMGKKLILAE